MRGEGETKHMNELMRRRRRIKTKEKERNLWGLHLIKKGRMKPYRET